MTRWCLKFVKLKEMTKRKSVAGKENKSKERKSGAHHLLEAEGRDRANERNQEGELGVEVQLGEGLW